MDAIRVHPAPSSRRPYSPSNPAPASAFNLDRNVPVPKPSKPGELLIRLKATTVVRDMLTWPETYAHEYAIIGNDFSGIVAEIYEENSDFKPGDEVFGMTHVDRAAAWAEFTIATREEIAHKPSTLTWEQAAALPLSAQTAYEALFSHAGVPIPSVETALENRADPNHPRQIILITGAAGAVGMHLVQLAAAAGLHVVAATSSNARNQDFLHRLGADETIEYTVLGNDRSRFDFIIDAVGGDVLAKSWECVKDYGMIISVDSASYDFVKEHEKLGIRRLGVRALFFIVAGSSEALQYLARLAERGCLQSLVIETYRFDSVREAYEHANGRHTGRGKVVLVN
ncbi:unnamed protein product [Penicillium salamii]|uniref:Enoyl reductase (ER) domain-containing protein n=1 Tax=Penicillium salamii TaxID=1612424 RepID=A0A9W4NA66_9EURO|nr:unnamed protein product [Penicillium salamii]CAG8095635.1 unnamed protein product [Penicillium salamii]CAG8254901.1 unnamed protein product [Penicillium salamii]CAG8255425.1 unnamed protein product [Penicillium salamii]CAG8307165.1 unnamed protein product [Penicillium salamii]